MIRILLVDDHKMFLDGIASILEEEEDIKIVQDVPDGELALKVLKDEQVDVVVLDYEMPHMNGQEATKKIRELYPDIKILILSMHKDRIIIKNLIKAGASGFILKNRGKRDLINAIRTVMAGKKSFGEEITELLIDDIVDTEKNNAGIPVKLTRREKEILKLLVEGYTSKQMAKELFIAESTVETHRSNLLDKTKVQNSRALIKYAYDHNLLDN